MAFPSAPQDPDPSLAAFRARQAARNRVLGSILAGLAVLFFAITLAKLGVKLGHWR